MNSYKQQISPENDAKILYDAMKGIGTDEGAILKVIANRSNKQRQDIKLFYKSSYGCDLIEDLKDELGGHFEDTVLALFDTPADYDAKQLYYAMKGAGTNEDTLIEIIASRPNWMLKEIKKSYQTLYGVSLEDAVTSDTSGDLQRLLLSLLQCNRSESQIPDETQAKKDATDLYEAGEGQWGTDESIFNKIFALRSPAELISIAKHYYQLSGKTLFESVQNEFAGDMQKLLLAILEIFINTSQYFATRINKAIKGWGTNDNLLIRAIVTRDEIDMPQIKQCYNNLYKISMLDDIMNDISGDYKELIVELASH